LPSFPIVPEFGKDIIDYCIRTNVPATPWKTLILYPLNLRVKDFEDDVGISLSECRIEALNNFKVAH
jgi:hypothetical protein